MLNFFFVKRVLNFSYNLDKRQFPRPYINWKYVKQRKICDTVCLRNKLVSVNIVQFVGLFMVCLPSCLVVHVFPARVRETLYPSLLIYQRQGLCRHYSGWTYIEKLIQPKSYVG